MNTASPFREKLLSRLGKCRRPCWAMNGLILILGLGVCDHLTGYEFSFSLFYLLPVSRLVWFAGKRLGIAAAAVSALV